MSNPPDVEQAATSPGPSNQPLGSAAPPPQPRFYVKNIGDPSGLGLFSFASTLLIASLYNLQARRITHPNLIIGMAVFCGGLAMIIAGVWAFPRGDAFGGTVYISYGAYWLSYATILIPGTGILTVYSLESEYRSALGIYLVVWGILTLFLAVISGRRNFLLLAFFIMLMITFWVLAGGTFWANVGAIKAGGVLGCITSFIGYFCGFCLLMAADDQFDADKPWVSLGPPAY